jgi:hypothetical protein
LGWSNNFVDSESGQIKSVNLLQNTVSNRTRVSFETSFDSKQPKLEPKLVSALSETKRLFRLFRFYVETENFYVSIEPKQTEDQQKQFDREHILQFFTENLGLFRFFVFFLRFFGFFRLFRLFRFYTETEGFDVSIEPKQTHKTHSSSLKESIFGYFPENLGLFRFVSVCYETVPFASVVSI